MCDGFLERLEWLLGIARGAAAGGGCPQGASGAGMGAQQAARSSAYHQGLLRAEAAQQQAQYEATMGGKAEEPQAGRLVPSNDRNPATSSMMFATGTASVNPWDWPRMKIERSINAPAEVQPLDEPKPHPGAYKPIGDYKPVELEDHRDFVVRLATSGGTNAATQAAVPVRDSVSPEADKGRDGQ